MSCVDFIVWSFLKSKISRASAAHLGIGDSLLWAVVTLLQGKSCYVKCG